MKTHLEVRNGVPILMIDGRPAAPVLVWMQRGSDKSKADLPETARLMAAHAFHLYTTPLPLPWPKPGESVDFGPVDEEIDAVLSVDPEALYMPRITVEPPDWWKAAHPEEMPVWENGKSDKLIGIASQRWLDEVCVHIDTLVRYLESRWDDRIIAYHPSAQNSAEWYYTSTIWECNDWGLRNYEPTFVRGFRRWLARRYGNLDALNAAWATKHASFDEIGAPAPDARRQTRHGLLRNPVAERAVIDFTLYQSVAQTDAIRRVSRAFKEACQWRKLVYIFYGYTLELCGLQEGISQFGHLDFDAVMDDDAVDVWCAPSGYYDRRAGGSGPIMALAESCNARGRVWCNEDDARTHLSHPNAGWGRTSTLDETLWVHRRNFMAALVHRSQMWFMDQAGGWYHDDAVWTNLEPLRALYDELYADPSPLTSDVAVVADERSLCQCAYGIELGLPLLYDMRAEINRMGTTPELWLQADYLRGKVTGKKLVIFLNAFSLTREERETIRELLRRDGATALWFYAPGVLDPGAASAEAAYDVEHIRDLTGIRVAEVAGELSPAMTLAPEHRFAAGWPAGASIAPDDIVANWQTRDEKFQFRQMTYPPRKKLAPLFAVDDPEAETCGHYADNGRPAMAVKAADGFRSVFVGGLTLPARVLANIARDAGVHLYCDAGDVVYADGRAFSISACEAGPKTIRLSAPREATDVHTGEVVTRSDTFKVDLQKGETRVYRLRELG